MLQKNSVTEAVSNEDDIKIKLDQACDTETSDDCFIDGETRASSQSLASGYQSGSSTDMNETDQQPEKSMCVTTAASCSHDLKQVDLTMLEFTEHMDSKWPNLGDCVCFTCSCYQLVLSYNFSHDCHRLQP